MKKFILLALFIMLSSNMVKAQLVSYNMTNTTDDKYLYYKVKSGDNLTAIASKYGTTVAVLQTLNTGININTIKIGQTIIVPKSSNAVTPTTVKINDTPVVKSTNITTNSSLSATVSTTAPTSGNTAIYHKVASGETLSIAFKSVRAVFASSTIQCLSLDARTIVSAGKTQGNCSVRPSLPKVLGTKKSVPSFAMNNLFACLFTSLVELQNLHHAIAQSAQSGGGQ